MTWGRRTVGMAPVSLFHSLLMVKDGCWSSKHGVSIIPSADVLATSVEVATCF